MPTANIKKSIKAKPSESLDSDFIQYDQSFAHD